LNILEAIEKGVEIDSKTSSIHRDTILSKKEEPLHYPVPLDFQ
jgi:hypothetical protein